MLTMQLKTSDFDRALSQYLALNNRDSVELLRKKAGDVAFRAAQAAKAGRTGNAAAIRGLWQGSDWKSKKPWTRGRDMWALFIAKLLSTHGFKLTLGRRRAKTKAERDVAWKDTVSGKTMFGRKTMTERRIVRRGQMKRSDWKRVSTQILRRRAARVRGFVGAFLRVAVAFGKPSFWEPKRAWAAHIKQPTLQSLSAAFIVPIKGGSYPYRGNKAVSRSADAMRKQAILSPYLQAGVDFVTADMGAYIARKLAQRAKSVGMEGTAS